MTSYFRIIVDEAIENGFTEHIKTYYDLKLEDMRGWCEEMLDLAEVPKSFFRDAFLKDMFADDSDEPYRLWAYIIQECGYYIKYELEEEGEKLEEQDCTRKTCVSCKESKSSGLYNSEREWYCEDCCDEEATYLCSSCFRDGFSEEEIHKTQKGIVCEACNNISDDEEEKEDAPLKIAQLLQAQ
jgi:hypothetical protein